MTTAEISKGGRPRVYASQDDVEVLMGRVAALELSPPTDVPRPTSAEQEFVGEVFIALIAAGVFTGGDSDLAPMTAVAEALLVARDVATANMGVRRQQRLKELRQQGALRFAGIGPE